MQLIILNNNLMSLNVCNFSFMYDAIILILMIVHYNNNYNGKLTMLTTEEKHKK